MSGDIRDISAYIRWNMWYSHPIRYSVANELSGLCILYLLDTYLVRIMYPNRCTVVDGRGIISYGPMTWIRGIVLWTPATINKIPSYHMNQAGRENYTTPQCACNVPSRSKGVYQSVSYMHTAYITGTDRRNRVSGSPVVAQVPTAVIIRVEQCIQSRTHKITQCRSNIWWYTSDNRWYRSDIRWYHISYTLHLIAIYPKVTLIRTWLAISTYVT